MPLFRGTLVPAGASIAWQTGITEHVSQRCVASARPDLAAELMKPRTVILIVMLTVVTAATVWRIVTPRERAGSGELPKNLRAAPEFQLYDQFDRATQLRGYLHRHRIILRFFDAATGPQNDPVIAKLIEFGPALERAGVVAFGISSPLDPRQKEAARALPIPILRDTPSGQPGSCTRIWGCAEAPAGSLSPAPVTPATFLIQADGLVEWDGAHPTAVDDAVALIRQLVSQ